MLGFNAVSEDAVSTIPAVVVVLVIPPGQVVIAQSEVHRAEYEE
jgi:hypothetical protein